MKKHILVKDNIVKVEAVYTCKYHCKLRQLLSLTKRVCTAFPALPHFMPPEKFDMIYGVTLIYISQINCLFSGNTSWALLNKISVELVNN
jgi:hypothetical protein